MVHQRTLAAGKEEDGSVTLSARVIVANLRSLHETSFGQTNATRTVDDVDSRRRWLPPVVGGYRQGYV